MVRHSSPKPGTSIYVHLPFCKKKCGYCHFYVIPDNEEKKDLLLGALLQEWDLYKHDIGSIESVYFGGGTPSLFGPERIRKLLDCFSGDEITLEANPEEIDEPLLRAYRECGINRLSIGVQSFDDALLHTLERTHSAKKAVEAVLSAKNAGFANISIDLMYDLPGQTIEQWNHSLKTAASLPITHLSLYNLVIEPHTSFFKRKETLLKQMPRDDVSVQMYKSAIAELENAGLSQYEISAFGTPSRHNSGYWTGQSYLGLGPSAHSFRNGLRFHNHPHLGKYCRALEEGRFPIAETDEISPRARERELLAIALRLKTGVDCPPLDPDLQALIDEGFLITENNRLRLTEKGVLFYDSVAIRIIE